MLDLVTAAMSSFTSYADKMNVPNKGYNATKVQSLNANKKVGFL